jgi:hypothetical protein
LYQVQYVAKWSRLTMYHENTWKRKDLQ